MTELERAFDARRRSRREQRKCDDFWDAFEAPAARLGPSLTSLPSLFSSTESPPKAYELANSCKSTDETEMQERKGNGDQVGGPPSQAVIKERHRIERQNALSTELQSEILGNSPNVCQTSFLPLAKDAVGLRHTGAIASPRWFGNLRRLANRIWAPRGMRKGEEQTDYAISGQQEEEEEAKEEEEKEEEEEEEEERRRLRYRRCMHCVYGTEEDEAACCYRLKNVSNTCLVALGFVGLILLASVGIIIMFTVKPPPRLQLLRKCNCLPTPPCSLCVSVLNYRLHT
jgi:hypothetical protein